MRRKFIPIAAGDRFNRLIAVETAGVNKFNMSRWKFRCDCGAEVMALVNQVRMNNTKSCGCLKRDMMPILAARMSARQTTHGRTKTAEYRIWNQMIMRCYNPASKAFMYYGARGIRVCDRWRKFENFYADMKLRPSTGHSIERIDNAKDYGPDNCKWATRIEQGANKRNNLIIQYQGHDMCVAEVARLLGMKDKTLRRRIKKGWNLDRALNEPVGPWRKSNEGQF